MRFHFRLAAQASCLALCALIGVLCSHAEAQNIGGVAGSDVNAGERVVDYRGGYAFRNEGPDSFAHRLYYRQSLDETWRIGFGVVQGEIDGGPLKAQSFSADVMMQFLESERTGGWDSAIRVDGLVPLRSHLPGRARIGWLNSIDLNDWWQIRGDILLAREIGGFAAEGLSLMTQEEVSYKLPSGVRIAAQMFNSYNSTAHFGRFYEQKHELGFIAKGNLTNRAGYSAGALFGVSKAAPDAELRLFFSYAF